MASKTFKSLLLAKLGNQPDKPKIPATLRAEIVKKGLDLKAMLEVRLSADVISEDIEEQVMTAALERIDNILQDTAEEALDSKMTTRKTSKIDVPTTVYGLRDNSGRIMSGLGLARILNTVLYRHVQKHMKKPSLVNRTGRFAHSAMVNSVVFSDKLAEQRKNRVSILFSYMTTPYSVFEKTEPWAKGGKRSPTKLITKALNSALKDVLHPTSFKHNIFNIKRRDL